MTTEADLQVLADRLNGLLDGDPEIRQARDRAVGALGKVSSAGELWDLYRSTAIPPGAPLVQITETQRAVYWTVASVIHILAQRPEALQRMLAEVTEYGLSNIQRRMGS